MLIVNKFVSLLSEGWSVYPQNVAKQKCVLLFMNVPVVHGTVGLASLNTSLNHWHNRHTRRWGKSHLFDSNYFFILVVDSAHYFIMEINYATKSFNDNCLNLLFLNQKPDK